MVRHISVTTKKNTLSGVVRRQRSVYQVDVGLEHAFMSFFYTHGNLENLSVSLCKDKLYWMIEVSISLMEWIILLSLLIQFDFQLKQLQARKVIMQVFLSVLGMELQISHHQMLKMYHYIASSISANSLSQSEELVNSVQIEESNEDEK